MEKAKEVGLIQGITVNFCMDSISYLQLMDDTIVFLKSAMENVQNLKNKTFSVFN